MQHVGFGRAERAHGPDQGDDGAGLLRVLPLEEDDAPGDLEAQLALVLGARRPDGGRGAPSWGWGGRGLGVKAGEGTPESLLQRRHHGVGVLAHDASLDVADLALG